MQYSLMLVLWFILMTATACGQSLLWEDQFNLAGRNDRATAARIVGDKAVVLGVGSTMAGGVDLVVRAYDLQTGTVVWQDSAPLAPQLTTISGDTADGTAFVAGYAPNGLGSDFIVRAYSGGGNKLWEDIVDKGRDDLPQAVVAGSQGVYAVGYGGNVGDGPLDGIVRAYDKGTGALLWEDQFDAGGDDAAWRVVVASDGTVVVAGSSRPDLNTPWSMRVRGYNPTTGALVWQSLVPNAFPQALVAGNNNRVFVAGDGFIALYQDNGVPVWFKSIGDVVTDLTVIGQRVLAVGTNLTAYDSDGNVIWGLPSDGGLRILVGNDVVFVAGSFSQQVDVTQFAVRAYAPGNGALLWTDLSHTSFDSSAFALAATDSNLLAAGWTSNLTGDNDFLVRAYSIAKQPKSIRDKIRQFMSSRLQHSRP